MPPALLVAEEEPLQEEQLELEQPLHLLLLPEKTPIAAEEPFVVELVPALAQELEVRRAVQAAVVEQ